MKGLDRQVVKTLGFKNFGLWQRLMSFLKNKTTSKLNFCFVFQNNVTFFQAKLSTTTKILFHTFQSLKAER